MRRALLVIALGCLSTSAPAHAQPYPGVALRWNHCFGEGTGASVRSFACDTNAGFDELVGSFSLYQDMAEVSGNEIVVYVSTYPPYVYPLSGGPLPEWWKLKNAGTCRQPSLSANFTADPANVVCQDWGGGAQVGGLAAYQIDGGGPGTARILLAEAVPTTSLQSLTTGVEYYSFTLRIRHDKTVGTGACAGCGTPMYITLNSLKVTTHNNVNDWLLSGP